MPIKSLKMKVRIHLRRSFSDVSYSLSVALEKSDVTVLTIEVRDRAQIIYIHIQVESS